MKIIEFKKSEYYKEDELYLCLCKGEDNPCGTDHSGRWVKAEAAEGLLACLKKVSSSLENMVDCACNDDCRPKAVRQLEIAQKTIKQAEVDEIDKLDVMLAVPEYEQRIAELEAEVKRLEIENWYHEVLELVQYNWWFELIEDVSEVGKEELVKIFKRAAEEAGIEIDV